MLGDERKTDGGPSERNVGDGADTEGGERNVGVTAATLGDERYGDEPLEPKILSEDRTEGCGVEIAGGGDGRNVGEGDTPRDRTELGAASAALGSCPTTGPEGGAPMSGRTWAGGAAPAPIAVFGTA